MSEDKPEALASGSPARAGIDLRMRMWGSPA